MTTIAVIGLGAMGSRIAARLLASGLEVVVWNRSVGKTEPLVDVGARVALSPADAASTSDAVMTMVSDPEALASIAEGGEGIFASTGSPTLIEMSTVGPAAIARLADRIPPRMALLDAPVLGSLSEVETGRLKIFVGGEEALFRRWAPVLSILGGPLFVGPSGSGAAAKLVANTTLFGSIGVLAEALALAEALGLGRSTAFEVLASTPIAAQAERRRPAIESGEHPLRFSLSLARKDAELIGRAATDAGAELRLAEAARS